MNWILKSLYDAEIVVRVEFFNIAIRDRVVFTFPVWLTAKANWPFKIWFLIILAAVTGGLAVVL